MGAQFDVLSEILAAFLPPLEIDDTGEFAFAHFFCNALEAARADDGNALWMFGDHLAENHGIDILFCEPRAVESYCIDDIAAHAIGAGGVLQIAKVSIDPQIFCADLVHRTIYVFYVE